MKASLRVERFTMVMFPVQCPCCGSVAVIKAGKQPSGTQRYRCQNAQCRRTIFQLDYRDQGRLPAVKRQIVDMALNGSGIRDTARVLGSRTNSKKGAYTPAG